MPLERFHVEGFEAFQEKIKELVEKKKTLLVLFSGSKDASGKSWCPDCVTADPVVDSALNSKKDDDSLMFLYVGVGERAFWKDPKCPFRTNADTKLKSVPTLVKWGTPQRLEEAQCSKQDMVQMMIEED